MNSKRSFSNTAQLILFIKIDRIYKGRNSSSSRGGPSKELSLDGKGSESVSALMDEEYAEEAEVASIFTDDDVSSHSSLNVSSSTLESNASSLPRNEEVTFSYFLYDLQMELVTFLSLFCVVAFA